MQLPLGIFGVAIASATLPSISRSAAAKNFEGIPDDSVAIARVWYFVLTIPSAVGLAVLGDSIVGAVYQMGAFTVFDTHQTASGAACYAVGLVGYSAAKVLNPAFYALHDARTPDAYQLRIHCGESFHWRSRCCKSRASAMRAWRCRHRR